MKEYEVSIVTPFHNVNIDIFRKGLESVKAQTYGFAGIEWIIVIHNSGAEYVKALHELCDEYDNIVLAELNNAIHTPSSPRNHGLKMAHGKYVGFLDGDDSLTPNCVRDVIHHMKKTGAQITWFRREYELEIEGTTPVTEIVLWDQTQKEIIIDRDHWDDEKMFSGVCGMVTSRMYDRGFLEKNNICFDETVPFGEDFLFNIEAYGHADKICYLPQTIGYHYYINSGSLVQKADKDAETLISYAKGFKKLFDTGLKYGFFMNAIMSRLMVVLSRFMVMSTGLTLEDRKEIRDILGPYVEMTTPLKVSKVYSEMAVKESYDVPRDVILNIDKWSNMGAQEGLLAADDTYGTVSPRERLLRSIIEKNVNTDMGNHYGFSSIYTVSGYRSRVPLMSHADYKPLIDLNTHIGESAIFVSDPIINYTYIVSNSGRIRLLPCTENFIKDYSKVFAGIVKGEHNFLVMESGSRTVKYNDHTSIASVSSMMIGNYMEHRSRYPEAAFPAGYLGVFDDNPETTFWNRLTSAVLDGEITQIYANNTYMIEHLLGMLCRYRGSILKNLDSAAAITGSDRENAVRNTADPERLKELGRIFREYEEGSAGLLKRIWPKLKRIIAVGTGEYSLYTDRLKAECPDVEFVNGPLMFPEMILGEGVSGSSDYRLYKAGGFFEFEPIRISSLKSAGDPVLDSELTVGQTYRVYVTNRAGLYRYNTEHLIKVTRIEDDDVFFESEDELAVRLELSGAYVTSGDARRLTEKIEGEFGIGISDYALSGGEDNIILYLELMKEEKPDELMTERIIDFAEEYLKDHIDDYRYYRAGERIGRMEIRYLYPETTQLFKEVRGTKLGITSDNTPPQHFVWTPDHVRFFEHSVME